MTALLCVLIGVLTATGVWLMLSRSLVRFLFALVLVSNVANLVIFVGGGLEPLAPALVDTTQPDLVMANALPQALVLTAIVIGFGLVAFTLVLALSSWQVFRTVDIDQMRFAEPELDAAGDVDTLASAPSSAPPPEASTGASPGAFPGASTGRDPSAGQEPQA